MRATPGVIYLCAKEMPALIEPNRDCKGLGFTNQIAFNILTERNTQLWPPSLQQRANLLWPHWSKQDVFYWNSEAPVGAIIFSERNYDTQEIATRVRIVPPSEAYGVGQTVGGVRYGSVATSNTGGIVWAPQGVYFCNTRAPNIPNTDCEAMGYAHQVSFDTQSSTQKQSWTSPTLGYTATLKWPEWVSLDRFLWRSDINVGLIINSRFADDGKKSTLPVTISPPSKGTGVSDGGLVWGEVAVNKAGQPHYTPSNVYLCSNDVELVPPARTCASHGFADFLEFGPFARTETKQWPKALSKTATVSWPNWNDNDIKLDKFDWNSQLPVGAIIYSERTTSGTMQTQDIIIPLQGSSGGVINVANAIHVIYLCGNRLPLTPTITCADRGYAHQLEFDTLSSPQQQQWNSPNIGYTATLMWPDFGRTLNKFLWRSDVDVGVILVSRYASSNGAKSTQTYTQNPPSKGKDEIVNGLWWGAVVINQPNAVLYTPSIIYMCSNEAKPAPPSLDCQSLGFENGLTFTALKFTETKPWPHATSKTATVSWPGWQQSTFDQFDWSSQLPVGTLIYSEVAPDKTVYTRVNFVPFGASQSGQVMATVEAGDTYILHTVHLCNTRSALPPDTDCSKRGFPFQVEFNTLQEEQHQPWTTPNIGYGASLLWPNYMTSLDQFYWRSDVDVGLIIYSRYADDGTKSFPALFIEPPSTGDSIFHKGFWWGGVTVNTPGQTPQYTPSIVYLCSNRAAPNPPSTNCDALGFLDELQFDSFLASETKPWPMTPAKTASVAWPNMAQNKLDQFAWSSQLPVGAVIYSEVAPDNSVHTRIVVVPLGSSDGGKVMATVEDGQTYTPNIIYLCSNRAPLKPDTNCSDHGYPNQIEFDTVQQTQKKSWNFPDIGYTATLWWPEHKTSLDWFRWHSNVNVGLILVSRYAEDGNRSTQQNTPSPPSMGRDEQVNGVWWGVVTINTPTQTQRYTPSLVYMCSNEAALAPPNTTCEALGFLDGLEFGPFQRVDVKQWPLTPTKTASVSWPGWNQNNLDTFDGTAN